MDRHLFPCSSRGWEILEWRGQHLAKVFLLRHSMVQREVKGGQTPPFIMNPPLLSSKPAFINPFLRAQCSWPNHLLEVLLIPKADKFQHEFGRDITYHQLRVLLLNLDRDRE